MNTANVVRAVGVVGVVGVVDVVGVVGVDGDDVGPALLLEPDPPRHITLCHRGHQPLGYRLSANSLCA